MSEKNNGLHSSYNLRTSEETYLQYQTTDQKLNEIISEVCNMIGVSNGGKIQ